MFGKDRPLGVTIAGGLEFLLGAVILITVLAILVIAGTKNDLGLGDAGALVLGVILAAIPMAIGYGLLKGWEVMWWVGVIFNVIAAIGGIRSFPEGLVTTVIAVVIVVYLYTKDVRDFFGIKFGK